MKIFWLHLLFVCLSSSLLDGVANNASKPAVINIGALLHYNSTIGKVARIAIQEAFNDVNSNSTILHGIKLNLIMYDSTSSQFISFIQALKIMEKEVVAIIGPQSSSVSHIVSKVASELKVPLVSFAASDIYLTPMGSPYFVRMSNSDMYQMTAIADIVDYLGWKEVVALFIDDDYGRNGIAALDDALTDRGSKVFFKAAISPDSSLTRSDVMDVLIKVSVLESRVIVLHTTPETGPLVLRVANYLGMMGNGYVWISTDWLSCDLDSYSPISSEKMNVIQGVLALRQHTPDSSAKRAFISRWNSITHGSLGLNAYGLYAYDSVWIIAQALDAFLRQGGNISFSIDSKLRSFHESNLHLEEMQIFDEGHVLLNNILHNNLMGLTGPLKFGPHRSRLNPSYDIINVVGNGYREIGYWSNYSGLTIVPPEALYSKPPNRSSANQHLRSIMWPDGTTTKPRGWVFPNSGKLLKIGVPIRTSFKDFVSQVSGSNDTFKGFCIDVFQAAVNLLPYPVPYQFVGFGDGTKNPNYTDLVNMIAAGNFDAAVGDIAIVTDRTKIVDFTQPYISSGLMLVAPFKLLNSGPWAFFRPFRPRMWGVIAVFFVAIGLVMWVLEHRINDDFRGSPGQQFLTILWFGLSTLTFSHRENVLSSHARMVLIIWLFVVLILTSSYTASLTSILTVQQLSSPIKGIDTLRESGEPIGYQVGSFVQHYLTNELNIPESRLVALNSPAEYADAILQRRVCAVVDESPYVELFLSSSCDFRIVGPEFTRSGWGFAFPRDSPLLPDLSTAILQLSENGDLQRIQDKWLTINSCSRDNTEVESSRLHARSFQGLFVVSGVACSIALVIYFTKICCKFHRVSRTIFVSDVGDTTNLRRPQTLMYLMDEKQEPSKKRRKTPKPEGSPSDDDNKDEDGERTPKRQQTPHPGLILIRTNSNQF